MFRIKLFGAQNWGPLQQGILSVCGSFILLGFAWLSGNRDVMIWNLSVAPVLLYCFLNPVVAIFYQKTLLYIGLSWLVYFLLLLINFILCTNITGMKINEVPENKEIYVLITIFYFLTYCIATLYKFIKNTFETFDS